MVILSQNINFTGCTKLTVKDNLCSSKKTTSRLNYNNFPMAEPLAQSLPSVLDMGNRYLGRKPKKIWRIVKTVWKNVEKMSIKSRK